MDLHSNKRAILSTLCYADIFDYPLSLDEMWKFLIGEKKVSRQTLQDVCQKIPQVRKRDEWYFLAGREVVITKRQKREAISKSKLQLARKIASYIKLLPTVQFIGISGGLAVGNTEEYDDIDFFIITSTNTVWITRFLLIVFLMLLGKRRSRHVPHTADKICLNMFMDEQHLLLPKEKQNLYVAHEVVQVLPLIDRNNTYTKFLAANAWVEQFLPNSVTDMVNKTYRQERQVGGIFIFRALNTLVRGIQLWYMGSHRTSEIVTDSLLAFHPGNYEEKILERYKKRLTHYGL